MKRAASVAAVVGVVVVTLAGSARLWLLGGLVPLRGHEAVPGLGARVLVVWDSLAVPHIVATSDTDAFAALGYVHARDRGWQLELLRHTALGRLSEVFGPTTIEADRQLRALEMGPIAARRLAHASLESRRALAAYARGVNAWFTAGATTLELRLLRHRPELWTPAHSLAIGVLQAWDLRTSGDELELARAASGLGAQRALDLLPDGGAGIRIPLGWAPGSTLPSSVGNSCATGIDAEPPTWTRALPCGRGSGGGVHTASNAWVVDGSRTRSRKPILANDPHLVLRAPSIWYLGALHTPDNDVVGATIPGVPAIVLGHTRRLAWGFTNAMVDDVDYVVEELSSDSTHFRTARGWQPVVFVAETIRVQRDTPVTYVRRRTARGPLVPVLLARNRAYAMRWVAQDGGRDELAALHAMARARDWTAFAAALDEFGSPEQNVVYADSGGTIAYRLAGQVPRRCSGPSPFPSDGTTLLGDPWCGWLPTPVLPHEVAPGRGWIATANKRQTSSTYPYFISRHYDLPYRARRIREMILADTAATVASVSRQQMDLVDLFGSDVRLVAGRAALAVGRPDVADRLRGWHGRMDTGSVAAAVYWQWYRELAELTVADESPGFEPSAALHRWITHRDSRWFDDVYTPQVETLDTIARRAMERVVRQGAIVSWGTVHHTVLDHPLAQLPFLGRVVGFRSRPIPTGGSTYTVNNSTMSQSRPPFVSSYGPSLRHVVDFGDIDGAGGFVLPGGQSGHPLSAHYSDQTSRWEHGGLWVLPLNVHLVRAIDTLVLDPPLVGVTGPEGR